MPMPTDLGVVDTLIGLPYDFGDDPNNVHEQIKYMFKDLPEQVQSDHSIDDLLRVMDKHGIEKGLIPVHAGDETEEYAVLQHSDRLVGAWDVEPNDGMKAIQGLQDAYERLGIVAAQWMPGLLKPPLAINDKRCFPVYAKCIELDIPVFVNGGVPGPYVPYEVQHPGLVDEICLHFPALKFVFRHCCEPWVDLTVKLLLKYPNLYYSTTGFAPKYYPQAIIDYANTRGAEKIMYGGYYPYGLDINRIFAELPNLPLKDKVWPKFLRENAMHVLKLDQR
jgi:predicted TIM-barrel fold metal-dependent hydrolase